MIRATDLSGRAVVDLDAAEKLGTIAKVILDTDGRRVAGFVVTKRSSVFDKGAHLVVPAAALHAIGPDALTVRQSAAPVHDAARLDALPLVSDIVGRKVVSESGRLLGVVSDVLIDEGDCRIIGYALRDGDRMAGLEKLFTDSDRDRPMEYLRAEADLRRGTELIVAPESAVTREFAGDIREAGDPAIMSPLDGHVPEHIEPLRHADTPPRVPPVATAAGTPPSPLEVRARADGEEFLDPGPDRI